MRSSVEPTQDYLFVLVRHKIPCARRNGAQYLVWALESPEYAADKHGVTMDTVDTMFIHLLVREGTSPRSDLKVYISKHEDARSVVNTPTGLLKYWVRTLRMVITHPTAFDSCCLMAIVFIVQADCCALTRPGPALCSQGTRMHVCKYVCGWVCDKTVGLCVYWGGNCEFVYPSLWSCVQECLLWQ